MRAILPAAVLFLAVGAPRAPRAAERFTALHEVIRHFDVAFVDRANPSALLLGALEGLKLAAPESQVLFTGHPELARIEAGGESISIYRADLLSFSGLEPALIRAAELVLRHKLAKNPRALEHAMIRQMVAHCGDPWSVFLESDLYERLLDDGSKKVGTAGLLVEPAGNGLRVLDVVQGSEADRAGIRHGMVVERIAGRPAESLNELEALALLRGEIGAEVEAAIQGKVHKLKLTEEPRRNIEVTPRPDGIAHVRLLSFQADSGRRLAQVMTKLREHFKGKLKGLVLDLRGNPGGLVTEGTAVVGLFTKPGVVVRVVSKKNMKVEVEESRTLGPYRDLPLVLLLDHRSASVSEIVALALRDNGRAKIVGEKSLGKGTVQVVLELADGSALKLSTGRYYSPAGTPIYEGIEPDVEVLWNGQGEDAQLTQAVQAL